MRHFHLTHFNDAATPTTNYGASFFSELEALQAAALANATRGGESGYYGVARCRRAQCRPDLPDEEIAPHAGTPRRRSRERRIHTGW